MTEDQKAQLRAQAIDYAHERDKATYAELEDYVTQLIGEAYQAGREDERKAVRLWGAR